MAQERNQEATVYIGNLEERCTEALVWELMLQAGPVVNVHLPKDRVTQMHQGYGFCEFASEEDADYAMRIMNQIKLYGKPIRVNKASSDKKNMDVGASLFIGNLDPDVDEKLLYDTFSAFGVIVQTPKVARDPDTGASKGYGFVSFDNFDSSDAAIDAMNGQYLMNKQITLQYAYKKDGKGERHGSAAERLLAAQAKKNNTLPNMMFGGVPPPPPPGMPPAVPGNVPVYNPAAGGAYPPPPPPPFMYNNPGVVWTIQTDLADDIYLSPVWVDVSVVSAITNQEYDGVVIGGQTEVRELLYHPSTGGYCNAELTITKRPPDGSNSIKILFHPKHDDAADHESDAWFGNYIGCESAPWILPIWSSPITLLQASKKPDKVSTISRLRQCERHLGKGRDRLIVTEDSSESIARHVWDCGVYMCFFFQLLKQGHKFADISFTSQSTVIELGNGTGIGGICCARTFGCATWLTDLSDALELLHQNVGQSGPQKARPQIVELDWNNPAGASASLPSKVDYILLSDVLYNSGSHDILLDTLDHLSNRGTRVLLAYKERHEEEQKGYPYSRLSNMLGDSKSTSGRFTEHFDMSTSSEDTTSGAQPYQQQHSRTKSSTLPRSQKFQTENSPVSENSGSDQPLRRALSTGHAQRNAPRYQPVQISQAIDPLAPKSTHVYQASRNDTSSRHPVSTVIPNESKPAGVANRNNLNMGKSEPPPLFIPPGKRSNNLVRSTSTVQAQPVGIDPVSVLTARLDSWKSLIRVLIEYFEEIDQVEAQTGRNYLKIACIIQTPLAEGNGQFLERGGVQDLYSAFSVGTKNVSKDHVEFAQFIENRILHGLTRMKKDIKDRIRDMTNDESIDTSRLYKEIETSRKRFSDLQRLCTHSQAYLGAVSDKNDPWLMNNVVTAQVEKQIREENRLQAAMLKLQQDVKNFECTIVESLKSILQTFYDWRAKDLYNYKENGAQVFGALQNLQPDTEWRAFITKNHQKLVDERAMFRPIDGAHPLAAHPMVLTVKAGKLERQGTVLKGWSDHFYVLTPAGYLHEFRNPEDIADPTLSLFIPGSTVTIPPKYQGTTNHFELRANSNGVFGREKSFLFRSVGQQDARGWIAVLTEFSRRQFGPPRQVPSGPQTPTTPLPPQGDEKTEQEQEYFPQAMYPPQNYESRNIDDQETQQPQVQPAATDMLRSGSNDSHSSGRGRVTFAENPVSRLSDEPLHDCPAPYNGVALEAEGAKDSQQNSNDSKDSAYISSENSANNSLVLGQASAEIVSPQPHYVYSPIHTDAYEPKSRGMSASELVKQAYLASQEEALTSTIRQADAGAAAAGQGQTAKTQETTDKDNAKARPTVPTLFTPTELSGHYARHTVRVTIVVGVLCFIMGKLGFVMLPAALVTLGAVVWGFDRFFRIEGKHVEWGHVSRNIAEDTIAGPAEKAEWLNTIVAQMWPSLDPLIFSPIRDLLEDALMDALRNYKAPVESAIITDFDLGSQPPRIMNLRIIPNLADETEDVFCGEANFIWQTQPASFKDRRMVTAPNILADIKILGTVIPCRSEVVSVEGRMKFRVKTLPHGPFFESARISFVKAPKFETAVRPLSRRLNVMHIPVVKHLIEKAINDFWLNWTYPKYVTVDLRSFLRGEAEEADIRAVGVIKADISQAANLISFTKSAASVYASVSRADEGVRTSAFTRTSKNLGDPVWNETLYRVVDENDVLDNEQIEVTVWCRIRGNSAPKRVGRVLVPISNIVSESKGNKFIIDDSGPNWHYLMGATGPAPPSICFKLSYHPCISPESNQGSASGGSSKAVASSNALGPSPLSEPVAGILRVEVLQATSLNMVSLYTAEKFDPDALPNPHASLYINDVFSLKTRVKTRTSAPHWHRSIEQFVPNLKESTLRVLVKDSQHFDHDPVIGMVYVVLADVLPGCSSQDLQLRRWFTLRHGVGSGKIQLSIRFKPVSIALPKELMGFGVGTCEVSGVVLNQLGSSVFADVSRIRSSLFLSPAPARERKLRKPDGVYPQEGVLGFSPARCADALFPVYQRQRTHLVIRVYRRSKALRKTTTLAIGRLPLKELADSDEWTDCVLTLYSVHTRDEEKRGSISSSLYPSNFDIGDMDEIASMETYGSLDDQGIFGQATLRVRFVPGFSSVFETDSKMRRELKGVLSFGSKPADRGIKDAKTDEEKDMLGFENGNGEDREEDDDSDEASSYLYSPNSPIRKIAHWATGRLSPARQTRTGNSDVDSDHLVDPPAVPTASSSLTTSHLSTGSRTSSNIPVSPTLQVPSTTPKHHRSSSESKGIIPKLSLSIPHQTKGASAVPLNKSDSVKDIFLSVPSSAGVETQDASKHKDPETDSKGSGHSKTAIDRLKHAKDKLKQVLLKTTSLLGRDNDLRIILSIFVLVTLGGSLFYLSFAAGSYFFVFDRDQMNHPKFLKNQVQLEIQTAMSAMPGFSLLTVPWFYGEVKGYSRLYEDPNKYGIAYMILTISLFLFFTDFGIYWIHRWLHLPMVYKRLHKPHHKWVVPTPFASHAFHPMDGYLQSVPYHLFVYLIPMQKYLYIALFIFVNCWTVMIHDGNYLLRSKIINSCAHHAVHHLYFNYNYGQYFTLWDRIGGSYRQPTEEQYDAQQRADRKVWKHQASEAESIEAKALGKKID
ncbi:hypothetical protein BZG36_03203 [Bifiguratus adelaidae]|uniref:Splicing factor 3B subunit 4 n=1 Tax=Bifiguratus adelaidae TaxID=1938954 RepID=A0A261Y169_9FUNG|nr:hypothetical protein BZG36_03203 [Bifiguratus adelaidae]